MANKAKLFDIKRFPQDMARLVCSVLLPVYRMKRLTPEGEKYRGRIKGGAIIAANHTSFEDPFLVGVAFWYRRMFFLAADVVMGSKFRAMLLRGVGVIEIKREIADIEAIRKVVDVLKQGRLLSVFPQGSIQEETAFESVKSGAVLMALQAGVPIIPMHIFPREHWYSRRKVVIGEAVDPKDHIKKKFPTTADIDHITTVLLNEMNRCKNQRITPSEERV